MQVVAPPDQPEVDLLIREANARKRRRRWTVAIVTFTVMALGVVGGYLWSARGSGAGPKQVSRSASRPVDARSAQGSIRGFDDICGISVTPPRRAVVRAFHLGKLVASTRVIAGDPNRDRYHLAVPPGRYRVVASNWDKRGQPVTVLSRGQMTVNFVNGCE